MKRLALLALPIVCTATPVLAADLGPGYYEEDLAVARPAPRVIERERIVERYYAAPREVYVEPRVYYEPPPYRVERPYAYAGYWPYWRRGGGYWGHRGHRW